MSIPGLELERCAIQICRLLRGCDGNRRFQISGARFRVVLGLGWIGFGFGFGLGLGMGISFDYLDLEDGFLKRELADYGWLKQKGNGLFIFNMIITLVGEIEA